MRNAYKIALLALLVACSPEPEPAPEDMAPAGEAPTNRIDVPAEVIQNLGITFAQVERRMVSRTLRLPGVFEGAPEGERVYRAPVAGRVLSLPAQFSSVQAGEHLAGLHSPQWREMQAELESLYAAQKELAALHAQAGAELEAAQALLDAWPARQAALSAQLAAADEHRARLNEARTHWLARVTELEELAQRGAGRATELSEARAQLATAGAALSEEAEKRAGLEAQSAELAAARAVAEKQLGAHRAAEAAAAARAEAAASAYRLKLDSAAATLGIGTEALTDGKWRQLGPVKVTADAPGSVLELHAGIGEIVEAGAPLFRVVDSSRLRFKAHALQSDMARLRSGLPGRVFPPGGGESASGTITLSPRAEADTRSLEVWLLDITAPPWARPGVTAELEVVLDGTDMPELAIPQRAIVQDGLDHVFFARDPLDPDKVIRTTGLLGPGDGRWRVVYSGVMEGQEVVLDGVYELKLSGAGKPAGKGHFHADGTWHAGEDH